jgi:hypothetical protein
MLEEQMSRLILARFFRATLLAVSSIAGQTAWAANDVSGNLITFNTNGGWSWFQDPRLIVDNGQLIIGSVAGTTANGATAGDVRETTYNLTSDASVTATLHAALQQDDHDVPAFVVLPDDRYMAIYQQHGNDNLAGWRISTNPGSTASWGAEQTGIANPPSDGNGNTYANPFYLSVPNKIYSFSRSVGYDPNYSVFSGLNPTNDSTPTYAYGGHFMYWVNLNNGVNGANGGAGRPYVKYASNGTDTIWFTTTEDHPQNYYNSLYAGYITFDASGIGTVHKSDGSIVAGSNGLLSTAQDPFPAPSNDSAVAIASGGGFSYSPTAFTKIYSGSGNSVASWPTDMELGPDGKPSIVFSVRKNDPGDAYVANSLDYYYTRWNGTAWQTHRMGYAGSPLYSSQNDYSGLAAIDPANPNIVYVSTNYTPDTDVALAHWEIFQGYTPDGGATWTWSAVTSNSTIDNIRPQLAVADATHVALVWMRGSYAAYTSFNTSVAGLVTTPLALGDMNRDGYIDDADISSMMTALTDLSSFQATSNLTTAQLLQIGDFTGDHQLTNTDLQGLITLLANGSGSPGAPGLAATPEPSSLVLAILAFAALVGSRLHHGHA